MVIRRIREHVSTHNWFAVAVDVGIVVLGVFLGTQVNNWNQARIEDDRGREYRQRLIGELGFDERQYAAQIAYYRRAKDYGLAALSAIEGAKPLSDRDFVIAAYQLTQTDTTRTKTGVYDEMVANGLAGKLGDEETQEIATDFYLSVEVSQRALELHLPYRTMLREVMPYSLQIRIRQQCGDRNVYSNGRLVGVATVHPCPMVIDPAEAAEASRAIRAAPEMERQMTRYIASLDEKLDNLEVARDQCVAFRERLRRAQGQSLA